MQISILSQMTAAGGSDGEGDFSGVDIVSLDDFAGEQPTFIKLDVEGAEVDALIGAQALLRACRPKIFIEVHTSFLPQFGHTLAALFAQIPADLYDIDVMVEGVDHGWRRYAPGLEIGVTQPMLLFARARQ